MLRGFSPALASVGLGLGLIAAAGTAHAEDTRGRVGAFRTQLGELTEGLTLSVAQGVRFESNLVRTANDAQTLALYGTTDSSDVISQTSLNIAFQTNTPKIQIKFLGDVSYANYSNFDQFSGFVTGGAATASWQFSNRCSMGANGRVERRVANFEDVTQPISDFQVEYGGDYQVACFILNRVRVTGQVFGDEVRNERNIFDLDDVDYWGWAGGIAFVSARRNEIGVRYRHAETTRPHDPADTPLDNDRIEGYTTFRIGNYLVATLTGGHEREHRQGSTTVNDGSGSIDLVWTPTSKLTTHLGFVSDTEDATDLLNTTSQTDRVFATSDWQLTQRVSVGGNVSYEHDKLDAGVGNILTGVKEDLYSVSAYLQHPFFRTVNVRWMAGYNKRGSDNPLRRYDNAMVGVSIGVGL
ncbi:MAG: outer membrane beta-barrel protein [Alphaproteobacteria bacterium]